MSEPEVLKNIRIVHDVLILKKSHKLIRRMQRALAQPEIHGYQVWGSSFLIMEESPHPYFIFIFSASNRGVLSPMEIS